LLSGAESTNSIINPIFLSINPTFDTNNCGFFDHLYRFIGSRRNTCNYIELLLIQGWHSTQPILTLS
jgi:hypothetical protein